MRNKCSEGLIPVKVNFCGTGFPGRLAIDFTNRLQTFQLCDFARCTPAVARGTTFHNDAQMRCAA
jgi:hypothetical protein